jgi:hypothetical protein
MFMLMRKAVCVALALALSIAPAISHAEKVAKVLPDFTVYFDKPTGFVFVKLPMGWKFVGKVDAKDAVRLPRRVVTELLREEDGARAKRLPVATDVR